MRHEVPHVRENLVEQIGEVLPVLRKGRRAKPVARRQTRLSQLRERVVLQEAEVAHFSPAAQIYETPRERYGQIRPDAVQTVFARLGEGRLQQMTGVARLAGFGPHVERVDAGPVPRSRLPVHHHAAIARRGLVSALSRPGEPDFRARRAETGIHLLARKPESLRRQGGQGMAVLRPDALHPSPGGHGSFLPQSFFQTFASASPAPRPERRAPSGRNRRRP